MDGLPFIEPAKVPQGASAPMTEAEARQAVAEVHRYLGRARDVLVRLYEGRGWLALGYPTWAACVAGEFGQSRSHLYRQLAAGLLEAGMGVEVGSTPEAHLRPVVDAGLTPDEARLVLNVVRQTAPEGKVTGAHVRSVVTVLREVVTTGAVDPGSGEQVAVIAPVLAAAITEETYERLQRQREHLALSEALRVKREECRTRCTCGWLAPVL